MTPEIHTLVQFLAKVAVDQYLDEQVCAIEALSDNASFLADKNSKGLKDEEK